MRKNSSWGLEVLKNWIAASLALPVLLDYYAPISKQISGCLGDRGGEFDCQRDERAK
jgi:hypothetical protein